MVIKAARPVLVVQALPGDLYRLVAGIMLAEVGVNLLTATRASHLLTLATWLLGARHHPCLQSQ